jgi:hypothetical protein
MKRHIGFAIFAALLMLGQESKAWRPAGWVWFQSPYAYDFQESRWYYMNPSDTMHCYNYASGTWSRMGQNPVSTGWSYFQWPYAFALTAGNWFYLDQTAPLYCYSYSAAEWTTLGQDWEPGRFIGPIHLYDSYAVVRAKLGTPTEIRRTEHDGAYTHWTDYDGTRLSMSYTDANGDGVLNDNEQVHGIFSNNMFGDAPQWNYLGLGFGATMETARAVLGLEGFPSTGELLGWSNRGVSLYFSTGGIGMSNIHVFDPN